MKWIEHIDYALLSIIIQSVSIRNSYKKKTKKKLHENNCRNGNIIIIIIK